MKLWEYHRKFEVEVQIAEMKIEYYQNLKIIGGRMEATEEERDEANQKVSRLKNEMFRLQTQNKRILEQKPEFWKICSS